GLWLLGFLPDGESLAILDRASMRVSLRDSASGKERRSFATLPRNDSRQVRLAPDGKSVFMGTAGPEVRVWDVASGKELPRVGGHKGQARSVTVSPDGKVVLTGGRRLPCADLGLACRQAATQVHPPRRPGSWPDVRFGGHQAGRNRPLGRECCPLLRPANR